LIRFVKATLVAALPFVVIVGVFAAVVAHHLSEPARQAEAFRRQLAVAAAPAVDVADSDFVALERLPCHFGCPAYVVRVFGSGRIEFEGRRDTCTPHPATSPIEPAKARRLIAAIATSGFLSLPDPGRRYRLDLPDAVVRLQSGAGARTLRLTDAAGEPAPLTAAIGQAIDEAAGDARWLPSSAGCPPAAAP
jgi:hypothetical protein